MRTFPAVVARCLVAMLLIPTVSLAWGSNGHRVVGEIAEQHLTPTAAGKVSALLGGESLARASTWADRIRSRPEEWGHTFPWHYVNIPDDLALSDSERNPAGDVLSAIEKLSATLTDPEAGFQERADAIRFLCHFVGDLHQPLHVGRADDRGGNDTFVEWYRDGEKNLHWVWDTGLIETEKLSYTEMVRFLGKPTEREVVAWQSTTPLTWAEESKALRDQVYDFGEQDEDAEMPRLSWKYTDRNIDTVEDRLLQAGVRLAGLLNELLDPPPSTDH